MNDQTSCIKIRSLDDLHREAKKLMEYIRSQYDEASQGLVLQEAERYLRLRGLHNQD